MQLQAMSFGQAPEGGRPFLFIWAPPRHPLRQRHCLRTQRTEYERFCVLERTERLF